MMACSRLGDDTALQRLAMLQWIIHPEILPFVIAWDAWATFAVGTAAVVGAYRVGLRQVGTAERQANIAAAMVEQEQLKLRAEQFEKRSSVYSDIREYGRCALHDAEIPADVQDRFFKALNVTRFLFGEDIRVWVEEMHAAASNYKDIDRLLFSKTLDGAAQGRLMMSRSDALGAVRALFAQMDDKFAPYLVFDARPNL